MSESANEPSDECHAYLKRENWGKVVDVLNEYADIQDYGDNIDRQEARRCERIADELEEQVNVY